MSARTGDVVFVGDAHLEHGDGHLDDFLSLLDGLSRSVSRVVFLGDLFNLWIGRRELEQPHQTAVVQALEGLRRAGVVVRYVEGNRDYGIGPCYAGGALDDATDAGLAERVGGHSIFAIHGDLANAQDRQYRAWRRLSRSAPVWGLFHRLPRRLRLRLAESVELRMRSSNSAFKGAFPERHVVGYARRFLERGHDIVVLGHFHVERELWVEPPGASGRVFVLPEWCSTRRHLRVGADGRVGFVDSAT